ncbi:MAG: hypothetical protein E7118_08035 [Bacteroidales bacterium]|nr:hypothetical protein [Bacteroidales bacterium]
MKTFCFWTFVAAVMMLSACGSQKAVAQVPDTPEQEPGMELLMEPNTIRAWGTGSSPNKGLASQKAVMMARSQIAQQLDMVVNTTVEDYCVSLEDNDSLISKRYLNQKTLVLTKQCLQGVRLIFSSVVYDEATGRYHHYAVVELLPEDYIASLLSSSEQDGEITLDAERIREVFMTNVNKKH